MPAMQQPPYTKLVPAGACQRCPAAAGGAQQPEDAPLAARRARGAWHVCRAGILLLPHQHGAHGRPGHGGHRRASFPLSLSLELTCGAAVRSWQLCA